MRLAHGQDGAATPLRMAQRRVVVAGWSPSAQALVTALERAGHRAIAVGDLDALALVRAGAATGLPCYRHLGEMLARVGHDAVLIGAPGVAVSIAPLAARAGSTLILDATEIDADDLEAAAEAALRAGTPVLSVRRRLPAPGLADLLARARADGWRAESLDLTLEARDEAPARLLGDAIAAVVRLAASKAQEVAACARGDVAGIGEVVVAVRHEDGSTSTVRARTGLFERLLVSGMGGHGAFDLRVEAGRGLLALHDASGAERVRRIAEPRGDTLGSALHSAAAGNAGDAATLLHEARLLRAVAVAVATGAPAPVELRGYEQRLRIVGGDGSRPTPRRTAHLRPVTA